MTYTAVLSYPSNIADLTKWHPGHPTKKCLRGAFDTLEELHIWANERGIARSTYSIRVYAKV